MTCSKSYKVVDQGLDLQNPHFLALKIMPLLLGWTNPAEHRPGSWLHALIKSWIPGFGLLPDPLAPKNQEMVSEHTPFHC